MHYLFLDDYLSNIDDFKNVIGNKVYRFLKEDKTENVIMSIVVLCGYISREEITLLGYSYLYVGKIIDRLIKKGYVELLPITASGKYRVSSSGSLYTFTKKGYDYVLSLKSRARVHNDYRKKGVNSKNLHDYLVGYNLIESLVGLSNTDIEWQRECVYGNYRRDKKTLACDGEVVLSDGRTLHFEEDLGNEINTTVLDKLFYYRKYSSSNGKPLLSASNPENILVFSYCNPLYLTGAAFSQRKVNKLADYLKDVDGGISVYSYFQENKETLPKEIRETMAGLLEESCEEKRRNYEIKNGKRIIIDLDPVKEEKRRYGKLKVSDVLEMRAVYAGDNPFYVNAYRKDQFKTFLTKRLNLMNLLFHHEDGRYNDLLPEFMRGCPIYMAPTCLMHRYVRFIGEFLTYRENLQKCLGTYFGNLNFGQYQVRGPVGQMDDGEQFFLRNILPSSFGNVCIEYPLIDLTAAERIKVFHHNEKNTAFPVHLIVIVDSNKEAFELSEQILDFDRNRKVSPYYGNYLYSNANRESSDIFYLRRSDLESGNENSLFFIAGQIDERDERGKIIKIYEENRYCRLLPVEQGNIL